MLVNGRNWEYLTVHQTSIIFSGRKKISFACNSQQLAALLITKQVVGNVKEALVPFVKQKVKEWKLKKQEAKAKKELDEKEGKNKASSSGNEKSDKPKELDTPLMNQAEIESTMAEYEVKQFQVRWWCFSGELDWNQMTIRWDYNDDDNGNDDSGDGVNDNDDNVVDDVNDYGIGSGCKDNNDVNHSDVMTTTMIMTMTTM